MPRGHVRLAGGTLLLAVALWLAVASGARAQRSESEAIDLWQKPFAVAFNMGLGTPTLSYPFVGLTLGYAL